ncbi:MAG: formylglycine-generating enzyme family protein [Anaerolineaceae bacterium]|nr:formylglycine-generating enzyme family protein [Anaerolineaceae bacterium]
MVKKFPVLILPILGIAFLLSACQPSLLNGLKNQSAESTEQNTVPQASETASVPTKIPSTPTPTEIPPTPTQENYRVSEKDQMEMIYIPSGEFTMGWDGTDSTISVLPGPYPDFLVHNVDLGSYWIDKYEVTNGQYQQCVRGGACRPCKQNNIPPQGTDYFTQPEYADYPVVNVSWYMARDFCEWAGKRLPTEAEWEKAARGTDGKKYPWGNDPYSEKLANICDVNCPSAKKGNISNPNFNDGFPGPAPVGSFPAGASPYGLLDMAGNVWEWTSTAAKLYPYNPNDSREAQYDIADGSKWPERILRGGPWNNGIGYQRSSFRYRAVAIYWNFNMGFRCAESDQ